ncbi:MAG: trigger factor [Lachnospiraceae bacterium]
MKKKTIIAMLAAAMVMMAGCLGKTEEENTNPTTTPAPTPAVTIEPAATETPKPEVTIAATPETEVTPAPTEATETIVTLGEYKGLTLTEVSSQEVIEEIQSMLESYAELVSVERAAELNDTVNINYVGTMDGVAFEGGTDDSEEGTDLTLGSGMFIPGFEEGLVGAKAGDVVEVNISFPDPYLNNPELSGKPVLFTVTVNSVMETVVPELTNDFVTEHFGYANIATYIEGVMTIMNNETFEEQIREHLMNTCTVENYPMELVEASKQNFVSFYLMYAQYYASIYGTDTETMLNALFGFESTEELEQVGEEYAYIEIKNQLILEKIAETEGLTVSEERYEVMAKQYAQEYGYETVEQFLADYEEEEVRKAILLDYVMEFCIDNAVIVEAE